MRILGIDLGEKRIGLALSDELGIIASPLENYSYSSREKALEYIAAIAKSKAVGEIIMGLPLNMNGSKGPQAENAEAFAEELRQLVTVEVKCWDERLTTAQAQRSLLEGNVSRSDRKQRRDMVAAALLLQSYLDYSKNQ